MSAQIALVTGANKGIGFEVARQLAAKGWRVFLGARKERAGREAAEKIGGRFLKMDVADAASIRSAAEEFSREADHLDVLFNNAGIIAEGDEEILRTTPEQWNETMRTNALGPLLVSQAFLPLLKKSQRPRIVNVSSGGGQLDGGADGWAPAYCISKTALNSVTVQLAAALPKLAVNCVCPGWVRTDMGGPNARESVADAAVDLVWLAVDAPQNLTGKFLRHRKEIPW
ncbi:MAG: short-chain dehydrogenase [Chthoniobacterales bacterium]|nr:MAG: short-chain dehydrogenase [Chthoniobacterales bacterium]